MNEPEQLGRQDRELGAHEEIEAAARALEVERERYRSLFESAPDPFVVTDDRGTIEEINEAGARLLAVDAARAVGKPISVFFPAGERRALRASLRDRLARAGGAEWELELLPRGGEPVPVACRLARAPHAPGESPRVLWVIRDVSERKRSEERELELERERALSTAAESARAQLDAIIRHLPIGVVIAEAPSGRMLTYNDAAERLFGFPPPLAETAEEYGELYRATHADGSPVLADQWPLARAIRLGERVPGEELEVEMLDGGRRVLRISAAPVKDAEGGIVAGVAGMYDVTDRRRDEAAQQFLARVGDVLSTSLDYSATVQRIAELCVDGLADYASLYVEEGAGELEAIGVAAPDAEALAMLEPLRRGIPRGAAGHHPILEVLRTGVPHLAAEVPEPLLREMAGDEERFRAMQALGMRSALAVPLVAGGRALGVLALARSGRSRPFDPADLELAQELAARAAHAIDNARLYREARRAARMQEETISIVSHDLRNALNAALTNADLLLDITPVFERESRPKRQMEALRRSLVHMHRLVQDLLEVDRIDRGRLPIHAEPIPGQTLVEELNGLLAPLAHDAGLHWEVEVPAACVVHADYARLVQVLSNLVGNAVKATPPGGRIAVRVEESPGEVRFHVGDTGGGIESEHLPRIFDRFFQVPERGQGGSGLGLTICRGIVEAHGGRIWAESRAGEGSTFSFAIPHAG